jgi:hypothetical protein
LKTFAVDIEQGAIGLVIESGRQFARRQIPLPGDGVIFQPASVFIRVNGQQVRHKRNSYNYLFH